jgi:hypothetical protein
MKSDEDVRMISAEAPVLFAKACELFILELTLKARPGGTCWLLLHLLLWLSLSVKWAGVGVYAQLADEYFCPDSYTARHPTLPPTTGVAARRAQQAAHAAAV